jgi:hypothetical protein
MYKIKNVKGQYEFTGHTFNTKEEVMATLASYLDTDFLKTTFAKNNNFDTLEEYLVALQDKVKQLTWLLEFGHYTLEQED